MDRPRPRRFGTMYLATQQLRLRNLVKIQGVNIIVESGKDNEGLIFFTLHNTKDDAAFYTSEALPQHLHQKWAEIVCPEVLKSNKNSVCVKIWFRRQKLRTAMLLEKRLEKRSVHKLSQSAKNQSALSNTSENNFSFTNLQTDKLLFSWGVYFSGLTMLSPQVEVNMCRNSLLFQLNGAYFSSPSHFTIINSREHLTPPNQRYSASAGTPITADPFSINSPHISRSSSPVPNDWQQITPHSDKSKKRPLEMIFGRNEVRPSYDLKKLLRIQEAQRLRLQTQRDSADIASDIRQVSVNCITTAQLQRRTRNTSLSYNSSLHQHQHMQSMGRKLSILLAEEQKIDPTALLRAQKLQHELETVRGRRDLLLNEKMTYTKRNVHLQNQLATVRAARQQLQSCLKANLTKLEKDKTQITERYQENLKKLQRRRNVVQNVEKRMSSLCLELREIYPIRLNNHGSHTICGISFPSVDTYMQNSRSTSNINSEHISPLAMNASLGYVAHLIQMISVIIDQPLRNPIIHEGSRSRIQDVIKEIPYGSRNYPLFSRSLILPKVVKYAIFLLNQNIAQICFDITGVNCDLRATIENLLHIFTAFSEIENSMHDEPHAIIRTHPNNRLNIHESSSNGSIKHQELASFSTDEIDGLSKSLSSFDVHSESTSQPSSRQLTKMLLGIPNASEPFPLTDHNRIDNTEQMEHRISRSVGEYSDGVSHNFKDIVERCYSNSDSNIAFQNKKT